MLSKFHMNFVEGFMVYLKIILGLAILLSCHKVNIKLVFG